MIHFIFQDSKEQHLFETEIFCNISTNVSIVTFDQCMLSEY